MTVASLATITHSRPDDPADPGDDPGAGGVAVVEAVGGERGELEEGAGRVDEPVDAVAGQQLAALDVPGARALRTAPRGGGELLAQVGDEGAVDVGAGRGGCGGGHGSDVNGY